MQNSHFKNLSGLLLATLFISTSGVLGKYIAMPSEVIVWFRSAFAMVFAAMRRGYRAGAVGGSDVPVRKSTHLGLHAGLSASGREQIPRPRMGAHGRDLSLDAAGGGCQRGPAVPASCGRGF